MNMTTEQIIICAVVTLVFGPLHSDGKRYSEVSPDEIIKKEGFPFEAHLVTTEDGYILTLHRIPGQPGSTPVFIQHGVVESSADFLHNGKNGSLAFLLHQMGYDVWLGNARGNTYSTRHTNLTRKDAKYWDFGWDQQGLYDDPAVISYIYNKTNEKMFYIGHSMGCTSFAIMAIERPDIAQNIKAMFALAPAVYATYMRQPQFRFFAPFWKEVLFFSNLLNIHEAFGRNPLVNFISDFLCPIFFIESLVCDNIMFYMGGFNRPELPKDISPKFLSKMPAGTSVKVFVQYFQQLRVPKFRRFNYPSAKMNQKHYGSDEPPEYDTSKIRVPVAVFYSDNDWIVGAKDSERFYEEVPNKLGIYKIRPYEHFDFLVGVHAVELVYSTIFKLMSQFE